MISVGRAAGPAPKQVISDLEGMAYTVDLVIERRGEDFLREENAERASVQ